MRKLMVLAAMLAMTMLVAAPALAQSSFDFDNSDNFDEGDFFDLFVDDNNDFDNGFVDLFDDNNGFDNPFFDNGFEQETDETGDVTLDTSIVNTGDNSNQCAAPLQFGNTGNNQNAQGFSQFGSEADDVEFEGSTFEFVPEQAVECDQSVEQAASASSSGSW
jgi:hypothetical protein